MRSQAKQGLGGFGLLAALILVGHFLITGLLPLTDPSEGRYAGIAKSMVDSANYTTPMLWRHGQHIPYMGKPPLGFWAMATAIQLFGSNAFAARLPAGIAGLLLLLLMLVVVRRYLGREQALGSVLITASSLAYFLFSGAALVDMLLTLFSSGALFAYFAFLRESQKKSRQRWSLAIFGLLGLGFLVKGPVVLVYFGLPAFLWTLINQQWKGLKQHRWLTGIGIFMLITVPWFILAEQKTPGFLYYFFVNENFLRFVSHQYGDLYGAGRSLPYGSALALIVLSTLPWSVILFYKMLKQPAAATDAPSHKRAHAGKRFLRYLVATSTAKNGTGLFFLGLLSLSLFWSLARQLLVYYLLPLIPFFAVWCAGELSRLQVSLRTITKTAMISMLIFGIVLFSAGKVLTLKRSTQAVITYASSLLADPLSSTKPSSKGLYFLQKTPNSAYFYGATRILPHADESPAAGVIKALQASPSPILIARQKTYRRLPQSLQKQVTIRRQIGNWLVLVVGTGG